MDKIVVTFCLLFIAIGLQVNQKQLIKMASRIQQTWHEVQTWFEKIQSLKQESSSISEGGYDDSLNYEEISEDDEFLKALKAPKLTHPESVTFKVGQIVQCIKDKASGVIVGWVAEDDDERNQSLLMPHYLVLTDSVEANVIYDQLRYLAQNEIAPALLKANKRILNLGVNKFFEGYTNGKYIMRPWLQNIYPRD